MIKSSFYANGTGFFLHAVLLLGGALLLAGTLGMSQPIAAAFLGIFLLVAALKRLLTRQELALDMPHRRFRRFVSVFGVAFGNWQPLPAVQHVLLRPYSEVEVLNRRYVSWQTSQTRRSVILLLSVPGRREGIVVAKVPAQREAEVLAFARTLAGHLGVKVLHF